MLTTWKHSQWETVRCEHCSTEYGWRVGGGGDEALPQDSAVHCPRCGRYQTAMFSAVRHEAYGFTTVLAVLAGVVALVITVMAMSPAALGFAVLGMGVLFLGRRKMAALDPNAQAPQRAGVRQHAHVILREEYELIRAMARSRGAQALPLRWRQEHTLSGSFA